MLERIHKLRAWSQSWRVEATSAFHGNAPAVFSLGRKKLTFLKAGLNDIKIYLLSGYAFGYVIAVYSPILIDPALTLHAEYGARNYPLSWVCGPIFLLFSTLQIYYLYNRNGTKPLYGSIFIFLLAIGVTIPIFSKEEFPHGNLIFIGAITSLLSIISIFVWSSGEKLFLSKSDLESAGEATLEYVKQLSTFVRQGAFAAVTLFGALFFAAYQSDFKYADSMISDNNKSFLYINFDGHRIDFNTNGRKEIDAQRFLLHLNAAFQITFFVIYIVGGAIRYLFIINLTMLSQYQYVAARLDEKPRRSQEEEEPPEPSTPLPAP